MTFYVNEDRFPCYNGRNADYVPDPIVDLGNLIVISGSRQTIQDSWTSIGVMGQRINIL